MGFKENTLDAIYTTLPMTVIIFILHFTIVDFPNEILFSFIAGTILVIIGLSLFFVGINTALLQVGEELGSAIIKFKKLRHILLAAFIVGFALAMAEPNMQVLSSQVASISEGVISRNFLIFTVAFGVGISLVLSFVRIVFKIPLIRILVICYSLAFILLIFTPLDFGPVSFDSGGVITGPLTVPFMLSLGIGITNVTGGNESSGDGFGLLALLSVCCIIASLLLGVLLL